MLVTIKIAFRNISRQKKRSFLLAGAIAFGMLVITTMYALTGGVVENLRTNFSHALGGHIFITGQEYTEGDRMIIKIRDDRRLEELLAEHASAIESLTKRSQAMPSFIFGSQQTMHLLYGVDFFEEERLLDSLVVTKGSLADIHEQKDALILPQPVGERLGVEPGETILVKLETLRGQQNVGEFKVAAFIEDQEQFGVSAAYGQRTYLNNLLSMEEDEYQVLNMFIKDLNDVESFAEACRVGLRTPEEWAELELKEEEDEETGITVGGVTLHQFPKREDITPWEGTRYRIMHINQIMAPVELMVSLLNKVGTVIFLVLLLVTMVGITNTFRMIMIERTREIGTMRAFGMQKNQVRNIFLMEAVFLGLLGGVGGILLSGLLALVLGQVHFSANPGLQFFLNQGRITFTFSMAGVLLNIALIVLTGLLAASIPAGAAAKMSPLKALGSHT